MAHLISIHIRSPPMSTVGYLLMRVDVDGYLKDSELARFRVEPQELG